MIILYAGNVNVATDKLIGKGHGKADSPVEWISVCK